jgi:RNA polymerase sigma-70 factor (ECF subfamily)
MNEKITHSTGSREEDGGLVKAFQVGDRTAFDALVLKHKDKVFNLCYWFLGDRQEAHDSAQDTFIKVYRSLKKFRLESAFSSWLYRIAANTCKNRLKSSEYRHKKKIVWLDNPGEIEGGQYSAEIHDQSPSPMIDFEKKERMMLIQRAIASLPTDQRTIVVLRDIEGLSYEEIANITGLNFGTVKSRLSRARQQLRNKLREAV